MKRILPLLVLARCGGNTADVSYQQITQEAAKEMMDTWEGVIMNVREQDDMIAVTSQTPSCRGYYRRGYCR